MRKKEEKSEKKEENRWR